MKRAAVAMLLIAACGGAGAALYPPAETGPEANAAIALAKQCTQDDNSYDGYMPAIEQATAHRDPDRPGAWIVIIPPGVYKGRLPPPGPGSRRVLRVDPVLQTCSLADHPGRS